MKVRITLTDAQLPPSREFLEFLETWLTGGAFDGSSWATYGQERHERGLSDTAALARWARIEESEIAMRHIARAYELFVALLIGDLDTIRTVQQRFRFVLVVGAPRSGGKYLTKHLLRALGHDPARVPAALAHDGFPEAAPWRLDRSGNKWVQSLHSMAEYLTMVELFFSADGKHGDHIVVPKKATKYAYAPGLFETILGAGAEGVVTVRHPVAACISTYELAGGLPADGRFRQRRNVERLWARDLIAAGLGELELASLDYFDAYLRYWEDYHVRLAMAGANMTRHYRVVAYGVDRLMHVARQESVRYGYADQAPEEFHVRHARDRHPDWIARAEPALRRVDEQWRRVGLTFPLAEIQECC